MTHNNSLPGNTDDDGDHDDNYDHNEGYENENKADDADNEEKKINQRPTTYCLESPSHDDDENCDDGWDGIDFGYGMVMMMVKGMKMKMKMTMAMTTVLTGETNNKTDAKQCFFHKFLIVYVKVK